MNTLMSPAMQTILQKIAEMSAQLVAAQATADYRAEAGQNIPAGYPEVLGLVALAVARRLECEGQPRPAALRIGLAAAEEVRFTHGGSKIYIPKGDDMDAGEVEAEIVARFAGNNHEELAAQYRLSVQTVRNIIERHRAKAQRERQGVLFDEAKP